MNFNFNISVDSAVKNTRRRLDPWQIHKVKFVGMEVREFAGKKDPSQTYKTLDIKFENDEGYYTASLWFPKEGDTMRRVYENPDGSKRYYASTFENMWATLKQTIETLVPGGLDKLKEKLPKCKSFDDICKIAIAITNSAKNKETNIKLIGKTDSEGKITGEIPRLVAINHKRGEVAMDSNNDTGEAFISDNYIGEKLFFSRYEEGERNKYLAKPTTMPNKEQTVTANDNVPIAQSDNAEIDDLLAGL